MEDGVGGSSRGCWRGADSREAATRDRRLLESVDDSVFELDPTGTFVRVNDTLCTTTAYDRESLLGEHVSLLTVADDEAAVERALERLRSDPTTDIDPLEVAVSTASGGRLRWELQLSSTLEGDQLVGIAGVAREGEGSGNERRDRQHRRMMRALDASREGIGLLDDEGTVIYVNDAYAETFGYAPEQMIGEHWTDLGLKQNPEQFSEDVLAHIETGGQWSGTTTCIRSDGSTFLAQHSLTHTDDDEVICVVQDVSDERQRKRDLERQERIIETLGDGVYAIDEDSRFVMANDAFCEMVGWEREELLGQPSTVVYDDEVAPAAAEEAQAVAAGEQDVAVLELSLVRKDGNRVPVEARFRPFPGDDGDGRCGVVRDISDRRERERKLEESERLYRTLAENFPNGAVGIYDEELRYDLVEGAMWDEMEPDAEDLVGNTVHEAFSERVVDDIEPLFRAAVEDGETGSVETEYFGRTLRVWATPLRDGDDEIFAGLSFAQDITEQVERERELEASNERLEQFAYAASHDLQEPLRMVSSYLTLIENRYGDEFDEDGQEFLEFAVDGAERMRRMIHGLLDYSRIETRGDPFEPVDLEAVVADVRADLDMRIEETDAEVTTDPLPRVTGDRGQLYQLFQNLLGNAIEYSGDAPPRVHVSAERRGGEWALSVDDQGVGMDPEQADRAFELFQRLHAENNDGTGIGLALCQRIVERHGGDISVDAEPDGGATFTFTLPAAGEGDV